MSGSKPFDFGSFIPGFDFLQQLASSAGGPPKSGPALQSWVAPTVDVEVLEKRIRELKTVQFWLEQNLVALKATVQALEVQRMTLSTLHSMNMNMADVARAFTLPSVPEASATEGETETPPMLWPFQTVQAEAPAAEENDAGADEEDAGSNKGGTADMMQWWSALGQQFQQIASQSLSEAARQIPAAMESLMSEPMVAPAATRKAATRKATVASKKTAAAKSVASKKAPAKKVPAKKTAAKKASARKSAVKKAATKKTAAKKTTAQKKGSVGGWPLPPVFKT